MIEDKEINEEYLHIEIEETISISSAPFDEEGVLPIDEERELQEELRGRKLVCTCVSDPMWCELHNDFE